MIAAAEQESQLRSALRMLPPEELMAVVLIDGEGWQATEVATVCDCSSGAIHKRVQRARARLVLNLASTTSQTSSRPTTASCHGARSGFGLPRRPVGSPDADAARGPSAVVRAVPSRAPGAAGDRRRARRRPRAVDARRPHDGSAGQVGGMTATSAPTVVVVGGSRGPRSREAPGRARAIASTCAGRAGNDRHSSREHDAWRSVRVSPSRPRWRSTPAWSVPPHRRSADHR